MELIDKYYNKLQQLIDEAKIDGVEIVAYNSYIGERESEVLIDTGIMVGIDVFNKGEYKCISTWKEK